jgi:drug/metabolite transporter (DMT)-like permease
MAAATPSRAQAVAYLMLAMLGWGLVWPANKVLLESLPPFWLAALRSAIAAAGVLLVALPLRRLVLPPRSDLPVLLNIALLHMTGFAVLAAVGLQLVPAGRSVVLAYTTPLWVMPAAALFLGERLTRRRVAGVALGLVGLAVLFNPFAFDWGDRRSLFGHGALLLAALCWALSMVHVRAHRWRATPFQLVPWEIFLATAVLLCVALVAGEPLPVQWSARVVVLLVAASTLGLVIPYWAIASAGRVLSANTVSLGMLGAPLIGIVAAAVVLREEVGLSVWIAVACVVGGVAVAHVPSTFPRP